MLNLSSGDRTDSSGGSDASSERALAINAMCVARACGDRFTYHSVG